MVKRFILEKWDGQGGPQAIARACGVSRMTAFRALNEKVPAEAPKTPLKTLVQNKLIVPLTAL